MSETKCGTVGNPCPDVTSFPVCDLSDANDAWTGVKRMAVHHTKPGSSNPQDDLLALLEQNAALPENHANPTLAQANGILSSHYLSGNGYSGICRSPSITGEVPDKWYAYKDHPGKAGKIVLFGDYAPANNGPMFRIPVGLSKAEAFALVTTLNLSQFDIACEPSKCATDDADGKYYLTADSTRLAYILMKLADPTIDIPGLTQERRDAIIGEVFPLKEKASLQEELVGAQISLGKEQGDFLKSQGKYAESMKTGQWIQIIFSALLLAAIGYQPAKDIIAKIAGRVKTTDFGKYIKELLKLDPNYTVKGRMAEAKAIWKMADTVGYRHIIIDAPTGEGKDKVVEAMMVLKANGDASVPPGFKDAPVVKINAAEFQANTQYRGNVADKVAEIAKMARKGKVIVYISEIDLIFLSGGSSSGDSEAVGKLLLDLVEDPAIKKNLIIVGTTSRGGEMLAKFPDLQRRFNWPKIHSFSLAEVADVLFGPTTKKFEAAYGAAFTTDVVKAAAKLAEALYRPSTLKANAQMGIATMTPRIDAVKTILEDAAKIARDKGDKAVTIDHLIEAVQGRCGQSFTPAMINAILMLDLENVTTETAANLPADIGTGPGPMESDQKPDADKEVCEKKDPAEEALAGKDQTSETKKGNTQLYEKTPDGEGQANTQTSASSNKESTTSSAKGQNALGIGGDVPKETTDAVLKQLKGHANTSKHLFGLSTPAQQEIAKQIVLEWKAMGDGMQKAVALSESPFAVIHVADGITPIPVKLVAERMAKLKTGIAALGLDAKAVKEDAQDTDSKDPKKVEEKGKKSPIDSVQPNGVK